MDFKKWIKQWLSGQGVESKPCQQPISHEVLERSAKEKLAYANWKDSSHRKKMLAYIGNNFRVWKKTPCEQCDGIDFLKMKSFDGFIVHLMDLDKDSEEVRHLFDYFKERIQALGYMVYTSDRRSFQRMRWVEQVERHYLKPRPNFEEGKKKNQLFGNINIELLFRDDEPLHLKFAACTYQDSQFSEAGDFEELVEAITA